MGVHETIKTVNATLRTLLALVVVGGAGVGGYFGYNLYHQPQKQLAQTQAELAIAYKQVAELTSKVDQLEVSRRLMKVRHRVARLEVVDVQPNAVGPPTTRVEFVEINDDGQPLGDSKKFNIDGDLVYIDYLRVTFDDKYVEESDLDRSTAICLFQRIFGENQNPKHGETLDKVGTRPAAYACGETITDFEQRIWSDFWSIANDPAKAAELGIHAAHEIAVGMRVLPGKTYEIELRSIGDMTFRPVDTK